MESSNAMSSLLYSKCPGNLRPPGLEAAKWWRRRQRSDSGVAFKTSACQTTHSFAKLWRTGPRTSSTEPRRRTSSTSRNQSPLTGNEHFPVGGHAMSGACSDRPRGGRPLPDGRTQRPGLKERRLPNTITNKMRTRSAGGASFAAWFRFIDLHTAWRAPVSRRRAAWARALQVAGGSPG